LDLWLEFYCSLSLLDLQIPHCILLFEARHRPEWLLFLYGWFGELSLVDRLVEVPLLHSTIFADLGTEAVESVVLE
jgi:hypothetical protein